MGDWSSTTGIRNKKLGMSENVVKLQNGHCVVVMINHQILVVFPPEFAENQQGLMDLDSYGIREKRWHSFQFKMADMLQAPSLNSQSSRGSVQPQQSTLNKHQLQHFLGFPMPPLMKFCFPAFTTLMLAFRHHPLSATVGFMVDIYD